MMPVQFAGLGGSVARTSILDSGADDTVLPDWIAAAVGLDLSGVEERPIGLAGSSRRYVADTHQWKSRSCDGSR